MNTAATKALVDSADFDAMVSKVVDSYPGMTAWIVVRTDGRIVDGVSDMRIARDLARFEGKGTKVQNAASRAIAFIAP